MAGLNVGDSLVGMKLQELLASGRTAQASQGAELTVVDVGNVSAAVLARGLGVELENVGEKPRGEFIVKVLRMSHKFFSTQLKSQQALNGPSVGYFGSDAGF